MRASTPIRHAAWLALAVGALYGRSLWFGLMWDDFAALRPRSMAALASAWTGPWDPGGVWPDFYRPLAITLYDGLFRVFGHHDVALHFVTLATLWTAACLVARVVGRESGRESLGLLAALLFVTHPETPASMAVWISQMFHLAAVLAVLVAVSIWQRGHGRRIGQWLVVLSVLTIGVLIKEDVVMVGPALVIWQWLRARTIGDTTAPSRAVVGLVALWASGYAVLRIAWLGLFTGYIAPDAGRFALNGLDAWVFTFAYQWTPSAHLAGLLTGVGVVGLAWLARRAWPHADARSRLLVGYGLALGLCASLPLIIASGHTRLHLMILSTAIAGAGAIGVVWSTPATHAQLVSRTGLVLIALWALGAGAANVRHTRTYAPCEPESIRRDHEVLLFDMISPDVRAQVAARIAACPSR